MDIVPVIADAIGFAFESAGGASPVAQLFGVLKERQLLLVADNLEHLLAEPGIEVLADLLAIAPRELPLQASRNAPRASLSRSAGPAISSGEISV